MTIENAIEEKKFTSKYVRLFLRWAAWVMFIIHLFLPTIYTSSPFSMPNQLQVYHGFETTVGTLLVPVILVPATIMNIFIAPSLTTFYFLFLGLLILSLSLIATTSNILLFTLPLHSKIMSKQSWRKILFWVTVICTALAGLYTLVGIFWGFLLAGHYLWLLANIFMLIDFYSVYKVPPQA